MAFLYIENYIPGAIKLSKAVRTKYPTVFGHGQKSAINATATATATQISTGYVTSTSASPVTITLPTATLLGAALGATQGTVFDLYVDNTAGANTVTIAAGSGMTASDVAAVATYGVPTFGLLTVSATAAGIGRFTFVFSSPTACTITRTA